MHMTLNLKKLTIATKKPFAVTLKIVTKLQKQLFTKIKSKKT